MKLSHHAHHHRRPQRGFVLVIILLILASIMLIFVSFNGRRLATLNREIRQVEQKQLQRLNRSATVVITNTPTITTPAIAVK